MKKNLIGLFKCYLVFYGFVSLYVGLNLPLMWDEGAHTLGGIFFSDMVKDALSNLPSSVSLPWLVEYSREYLTNYYGVVGAAFFYPMGHHLISAIAFLVLGPTVFAAKVLAVLFMLGCLYYVFRLGELLFDARTGVAGAFFLSLVPHFMILGSRVLLDVPAAFFITACLYYFFKATQTRERISLFGGSVDRNLLAATLLALAGILSRYPVLLFYPIAYGYLVVSSGFSWLREKRFYLPLLAILGLFAYVGFIVALGNSEAIPPMLGSILIENTVSQLTLSSPIYGLMSPPITSLEAWLIYPRTIIKDFNLPFFLLSLAGVFLVRKRYLKTGDKRLLAYLFALFVLFLAFSLVQQKQLRYAYSFVALFALAGGVMYWFLYDHVVRKISALSNQAALQLALILFTAAIVLPTAFPDAFEFFQWRENYSQLSMIEHEKEFMANDAIARRLERELPANSEIVFGTSNNNFNPPSFSFYLLQYDRNHSMKVTQPGIGQFRKQLAKGVTHPVYVFIYDGPYQQRVELKDFVRSNPDRFRLYTSFEGLGINVKLYEVRTGIEGG